MRRNLSFAAVRLGMAASALLLAACVSQVRLAPDAHGWQNGGTDAIWRSDPVLVVAQLDTDAGPLPAHGRIVNSGRAPVRVTLVPDVVPPTGEGGPTGGTEQPPPDATINGLPVAVPASFDLAKGNVEFALRADARWAELPAVGASISWTIVVTTPSGEIRCPFRFRVESATRTLSKETETAIAAVLVAAAFVTVGYYVYY